MNVSLKNESTTASVVPALKTFAHRRKAPPICVVTQIGKREILQSGSSPNLIALSSSRAGKYNAHACSLERRTLIELIVGRSNVRITSTTEQSQEDNLVGSPAVNECKAKYVLGRA